MSMWIIFLTGSIGSEGLTQDLPLWFPFVPDSAVTAFVMTAAIKFSAGLIHFESLHQDAGGDHVGAVGQGVEDVAV